MSLLMSSSRRLLRISTASTNSVKYHFAGAIRAETANVSLRFLPGRFLVPDEDCVEADVPQDLGEAVFGKSTTIEIVVARLPVLVTDDLGDPVNQIGALVIEDRYDMDDGRLLVS